MGLVSFLCWVWSSGNSISLSLSPSLPTPLLPEPCKGPSVAFQSALTAYQDVAHSPKRVTFTLPTRVYAWLEAMAVLHNYGSVHKSIRDLLAWARTGRDDDMEWLFAREHDLPPCLTIDVERCSEPSVIAGSQCARGGETVTVDARLSDGLNEWISRCVEVFGLAGPSVVLDTLCRCAIELHAADDIFESDESGHDLPATTAELYHDIGIIRSSRSQFANVRTGCT